MNPYRRALVLAAPWALAACATPITLITPERQNIGGAFSVDPGGRWNRYGMPIYDGNVEVWTLDGLSLNALLFVTGTKDGEPIFTLRQSSGSRGEAPPPFRSNMSALQIKELFGATLTRAFGTTNVETSALRTSTFGGQPGFAFDTAWTGRDEVDRLGRAVGAVRNGRLYMIWFQGTKLYHYKRYLPDFERIVASVRFAVSAA